MFLVKHCRPQVTYNVFFFVAFNLSYLNWLKYGIIIYIIFIIFTFIYWHWKLCKEINLGTASYRTSVNSSAFSKTNLVRRTTRVNHVRQTSDKSTTNGSFNSQNGKLFAIALRSFALLNARQAAGFYPHTTRLPKRQTPMAMSNFHSMP